VRHCVFFLSFSFSSAGPRADRGQEHAVLYVLMGRDLSSWILPSPPSSFSLPFYAHRSRDGSGGTEG